MKTAILLCLVSFLCNAAPVPPIFWSTTGSSAVTTAQIQTLMVGAACGCQLANTGNSTIPASATIYFPLNSVVNPATFNTDVSGATRSILPCQTLFTNMQMIASAAPGANKATITMMTNGIATLLSCSLSSNTKTNDALHWVSVPAGTEVGWRMVTGSGIGSAKYSISVETRQ